VGMMGRAEGLFPTTAFRRGEGAIRGWKMGARDKRPAGNWQNPLASKVVASKNIL